MPESTPAVVSAQLAPAASPSLESLTVYKSPTCGCCGDWVKHMERNDFPMSVQESGNLDELKDQYQVPVDMRSCHTAVSQGGYVFEGHVPARYIQQFLEQPPAGALGLTVPGMPLGSPGMEVDDRFMPYQVWLLNKDGSREVYAAVESPEQQ